MACTAACPTKDHSSYGACLRSKRLSVTGLESTSPSFTRESERKWNAELDAYASARKEGLQPQGTSMTQVDAAKRAADQSA